MKPNHREERVNTDKLFDGWMKACDEAGDYFFPELEDDEFWDEYCEGEGVDE